MQGLRAAATWSQQQNSNIKFQSSSSVGRHQIAPHNRRIRHTVVVIAKGSSSDTSGRGFGKNYELQDEIRQQRQVAVGATEILAKLLQAQSENKTVEVATDYVESLTEEFFHIGGAYLGMAKKENDEAVAAQLETALRVAMEVKNSTLRAEIQLFNKLLGVDSDLERMQVLNSKSAGDVLSMNDFYFFTLLDRMIKDVGLQNENPQKEGLVKKLEAVKREALSRLPPDVRSTMPPPKLKK